MNFRIVLALVVVGFAAFCGWLVIESGLFERSSQGGQRCILLQKTSENEKVADVNIAAEEAPKMQAVDLPEFGADGGPEESFSLGSTDPKSGYKFQLELSSKGAAIRKAIFSEFDDRDPENPRPLEVFSPIQIGNGNEVLSMSLTNFGLFLEPKSKLLRPFALGQMCWESSQDGLQSARFQVTIKDDKGQPVIRLIKTYNINQDSYLLDSEITVENLSGREQKFQFNLPGAGGVGKESFRTDIRKVVAGYKGADGEVKSKRLEKKTLHRAEKVEDRQLPVTNLLWAATVNKYFAAILVPQYDEGEEWVAAVTGRLYNPDGDKKADSGDESIGMDLRIAPGILESSGTRTYKFQIYIGPKDKSLFDKSEMYSELRFVETIDFSVCCCPASIISPLAFGILAIMKWMYGSMFGSFGIGNYGVVIIILVFLMRLIMHPITKKRQGSMSKMQKLAPMAEEIKKKYANSKAEMNKKLMELYRQQGATPIMGFLPMFIQMPIWIALWSAIYASIDLRGAAFLPFWITDLSVPDALVRFSTITIPWLDWKIESLNLLPILMGLAFFLQQKLMPKQAAANPQVAQQQKMMMIMMPLLFPLMLYKAPSGVNLYIMSSTFAGVIEQYVIRKHIREKDETESKGLVAVTKKTGGKVKKKKPKPFFRY